MAVREIVYIDEELCNGCGDCVPSCAEGAIKIIDGKARLIADNLCDGLGACLGDCPLGAIKVEEREADEFDEDAVEEHLAGISEKQDSGMQELAPMAAAPTAQRQGCPGSAMRQFAKPTPSAPAGDSNPGGAQSALGQWPVQLHLLPPTAPFFQGADVLLAADCTAFSVGDFHQKHLKGKALAIACPKLDQGMDIYRDKLIGMIDHAKINTLTVMIMEVPCCGGLLSVVNDAVSKAERKVPVKKIVVGVQGNIVDESWI